MIGRLLAAFATLVGRPFMRSPAYRAYYSFSIPTIYAAQPEGLRGLFAKERRWSRKSLAGPERLLWFQAGLNYERARASSCLRRICR